MRNTEGNAEISIYWPRHYGWRSGERYIAPNASASDVVRFERDEYGNAIDTPGFFLAELDKKEYTARDVVWVCRTRDHARRYGGDGYGQPYKEEFGPQALIVATDQEEPERGYLVLFDASRLDPAIVKDYARYRETHRTEGETLFNDNIGVGILEDHK